MGAMKMMGAVLVIGMLGLFGVVAADTMHRAHGEAAHQVAMERGFDAIGATPDQRQQLLAAHERHETLKERLHATMSDAHERLTAAIHAIVFDERAIRDAAADYAAAQTDLFVARAEMLQEARRILTPDQYEQLEALHADRSLHPTEPPHHRNR